MGDEARPVRSPRAPVRRSRSRAAAERVRVPHRLRAPVGTASEISRLQAVVADLAERALLDEVTRLPNRSGVLAAVREAVATGPGSFAVLVADMDAFELVSAALGATIADQVLEAVADRLARVQRIGDTAGRGNGDRFVLVFRHVPTEAAASLLARRVQVALRRPVLVAGHELHLSCSVGVAMHHPGETAEEVLRHADIARAHAVRQGRSGLTVYDGNLRRKAESDLRLEGELHRAMRTGDIELHYQPVVDIRTTGLASFEALSRWRHPSDGMLAPGRWIGIAEASTMAVAFGDHVLASALVQARAWRDLGLLGPRRIAVNISARQLARPDFAHRVAAALEAAGVPGTALCVEVTETAILQDLDSGIANLRAVRALGVSVAIDDFGTGYSSLAYLRRLPVDVLKIDQSFIDGLGSEHTGVAIVASVIDLAHALGLTVVAEGVETTEHLSVLYELGCDRAQGYLFSRPVPPSQARELLVADELERGTLVGAVPQAAPSPVARAGAGAGRQR